MARILILPLYLRAANERREELESEARELAERLERERMNKVIAEKEIEAVNKRNAGQMSRLKRQLSEARLRADRWIQDNDKLQERIDVLQKQLYA